MPIRIVRLGSPREPGEGLRIGTVRRPPRGVRKSDFASRNWYDVWYPNLSPSPDTILLGQRAQTEAQWRGFVRRYRREMAAPEHARTIEMLAALSHRANFSVGCYCESEDRCHRSILRLLLREAGAQVTSGMQRTSH
jgi:uncharacterized protein YeaO (DUF488 family)